MRHFETLHLDLQRRTKYIFAVLLSSVPQITLCPLQAAGPWLLSNPSEVQKTLSRILEPSRADWSIFLRALAVYDVTEVTDIPFP